MASRAGQLVTREELLDIIWPDTMVTDGALRFCIRRLRKVLRDTPDSPRFIETVHRRGYRFIAPVRPCFDSTRPMQAVTAQDVPQATLQWERPTTCHICCTCLAEREPRHHCSSHQ